MLAEKTFSREQVAACREAMAAPGDVAVKVLALDRWFVHRVRGNEAKGGAAKRVRALADGVIAGEAIDLDEPAFAALVDEFLAEIEERFS